jgi:hypothetical protein
MVRAILGQVVGVASISLWLALTVFFMSKASTPNAPDAGNWFFYFASVTIAFVLVMTFWSRIFGERAGVRS